MAQKRSTEDDKLKHVSQKILKQISVQQSQVHRPTGPQMCRSTNMYFCRKKPIIIIMHTDATKSPVPVGKGGGRGIQVTTNLITAGWMSHNYAPATMKSDSLVLL